MAGTTPRAAVAAQVIARPREAMIEGSRWWRVAASNLPRAVIKEPDDFVAEYFCFDMMV
jgi:hypothetical protein